MNPLPCFLWFQESLWQGLACSHNAVVQYQCKSSLHHWAALRQDYKYSSGPGGSKLTMSLVNVSLKFQTLISQICQYFLLKKCEKLLQCKSFSHFFNKKFNIFGYKAIKHLTSWPLNELVKLRMLWTTGPWWTAAQENSSEQSWNYARVPFLTHLQQHFSRTDYDWCCRRTWKNGQYILFYSIP